MSTSRRNFIKTTAAATAASLFTLPELSRASPVKKPASAGYELLFLATDWGYGGTYDEFCSRAKKEGYDGFEVWWPNEKRVEELFAAAKKYNLQIGFLCGGWQKEPAEHLATFKKNLDTILANTYQKPLYINCHSGKDYFSYEHNKPFIEYTDKRSQETGIPIYHETHRNRMMYAAHVTRDIIAKHPKVRLTLDISHWCAVHESLLADQEETVKLALERVDHIHSRVGYQQGPQISDPRAPEFENIVKAHLAWWDTVIARKKQKGERMTILTEFGPPDYLPTLPYTRQPVADQWAINVHMMNMLRKRYA